MTDVSSSTLRAIEALAARNLSEDEMEREAHTIVESLGEEARTRGGVPTAIGDLEAFRETLANTLAQSNAHGPLLSAYTYAANSIKPVTLKISDPKR